MMTRLAYMEIDHEHKVASLCLNRPEALNSLDVATAKALHDAVRSLGKNDELRCIVLKGEGRAFLAGGDVASFAEDFTRADQVLNELLDWLDPVVDWLASCPIPVIACVHGAVAGAGISLMCACDLVLAAEGTRFLMAYDKIGGVPDCGASYFLPRQIGSRRAAEFMLLGETWTAEQALEYGLINKIFPADSFAESCQKVIASVSSGPTRSYVAYKELAAAGIANTLQQQLDAERKAFCAATKTEDFKSGVSAFLNKEKAIYAGR